MDWVFHQPEAPDLILRPTTNRRGPFPTSHVDLKQIGHKSHYERLRDRFPKSNRERHIQISQSAELRRHKVMPRDTRHRRHDSIIKSIPADHGRDEPRLHGNHVNHFGAECREDKLFAAWHLSAANTHWMGDAISRPRERILYHIRRYQSRSGEGSARWRGGRGC